MVLGTWYLVVFAKYQRPTTKYHKKAMSDIVNFSAEFNKPNIPHLNQAQLVYAYFEIRPGATAANVRMPLNFSLVLDKSGSMMGGRIAQLRDAVCTLIDQLEVEDTISIVAFNGRVDLMVPATSAFDKKGLQQKVRRLSAGGTTNMGPAMEAALGEIRKQHGGDRVSRLIILTDGETSKEELCQHQAMAAGNMGVPIVALGLGSDWNEDLLLELERQGATPGYAAQIKQPSDINGIFQDVFSQMQVAAQNLTLRLLLVQGVEARRVWQVTPLIKDVSMGAVQGRTVSAELSELSDSGAAYLIELLVPPRAPGRYRFAQAELAYDVPVEGQFGVKQQVNLMLDVTTDPYAAQQVNGRVMNIVERVTAFKLQTQALSEADAGNIVGATRKLRAAHTRLLDLGEAEMAQAALNEAERLEQGQGFSNQGRKTIKLESRKTVRLSDLDLP